MCGPSKVVFEKFYSKSTFATLIVVRLLRVRLPIDVWEIIGVLSRIFYFGVQKSLLSLLADCKETPSVSLSFLVFAVL